MHQKVRTTMAAFYWFGADADYASWDGCIVSWCRLFLLGLGSRSLLTQGRRSFLTPTLGFEAERPWRSPSLAKVIRINRRTSRASACQRAA
jgi:hypothetical protein